jgi:hypothetical protein
MASTANPPNLRASLIALYRTFAHDLFGGYRPERHYMRGPGPKWQEKHGQKYGQKRGVTQATTPLFPDSVPA